MGRLVRNLLDLSRIEGGALKPEFEPCDLEDLVSQVVRRAKQTTAKAIEVEIEPSTAPVLVDQIYLGQILANLIENAVRHGGNLIRVGGKNLPNGMVEIAVEDNGAGVPDAALPRLFEKFYQAGPGGVDKRRGMGIGMTVVAGLTHAMEGEVEACRGELGGLRVAVHVRAAALPAEPPPAPDSAPDSETP